MDLIYKHLETLKPALQQMACLFAYIGGDVEDDDTLQLSVHGTCMMGELPILLKELIDADIVVHETYNGLTYEHEHIRTRYYGQVMHFAIEQHPEWLEAFDEWPLTRYKDMDMLQRSLRRCATGKAPQPVMLNNQIPPYLISIAHIKRYEPMISMIRDVDFPAFISACIRKWMKADYTDPLGMIKRQFSARKWDDNDSEIREMKALINYYNFIMLGQYTPPVGIRMTYYDQLAKGVHAMAQGKGELALKIFADAQKVAMARGGSKENTWFLTDGVAAFYWVVAQWTSEQKDHKTQLEQFVQQAKNGNAVGYYAAVLLAEALLSPVHQVNMDAVSNFMNPITREVKEQVLQRHLVEMVTAFFSGVQPNEATFQPNAAVVRHLGTAYITLNKFENKILLTAFGKLPILSYIKIQEPWELLLDRLILSASKRNTNASEEEHRVMYIILSDGESVELREQNRLKDGRWGSGKSLPWSRFMSGMEPFMDRIDQAVVGDVRYAQANKLTIGLIMPHLAGSDRVYTGDATTALRRVTIETQIPYVILKQQETGFHIQTNLHYQDLLLQHSVYHRNDEMHYTYFPMNNHAREILRDLLSVTDYPLAAAEKFKKLLPLISNSIEIHSDILPEEGILQTLNPQSQIIIRLTPDPTNQTMFDAYLLVRPLQGGKMTLPPAQGDRGIIDYNETSGRVSIERDLQTEQKHLEQMLQYCSDHNIEFSAGLNAHLNIENALDLLAFVSANPEISMVEWPEGERLRMHRAQNSDYNLSLVQIGGWFKIEGKVKLEDNSILSAKELLEALGNSHKGYVVLNNGDFLWLNDKLRKQLDALESLTITNDKEPLISTLQTGMLYELMNGEICIEHDKELNAFKQRIEAAEHLEFPQPQTLQATLRPYQLEGYQWMSRLLSWGAGACLADDMGLGKTMQTISIFLNEAENGPALVVAPTSVVTNWKNEILKFAPSLRPLLLAEAQDRAQFFEEATKGDVVLVSYATMPPIHELIAQKEWNIVCLDEAHIIKNRSTKSSAACMNLKAKKKLILTGTPVQNHLGELWNLFQFINPGLLGTYETFSRKYSDPIAGGNDEQRYQQLQRLVAPFLLRRTKNAVAKDLPKKTEITLDVELSNDEMAFYELLRKEAEAKFEAEGEMVNVNTLAEISKLRRTACSAELTHPDWTGGSSKVNVFMDLVQNITDAGNSVLVFSQFTSFLSIIRQELDKNNILYYYLDGSVPLKQRETLVNDFQKGKRPVFLISLKAGGVGLNLTAANYVIHLDPWWNPAIEQQATDRAYRIGQQQAVTVYHLVAHHTIEEKIMRLHAAKRHLADSILEGADQNFKLTSKDILEMLNNNWE